MMDKYDEVRNRLMSIADRKRTMKQLEAQAEMKAIEREYTAYIDGVFDAVKAIEQMATKDGDGNKS